MAIDIKLDANAVRALIKDDDDFKLRLQNAIIAEICRGMFAAHVTSDITKVVEQCFQQHQHDLIKAVKDDEAFRHHLDRRLADLVKSVRADTYSYGQQKELSPDLKRMVDDRIGALITENIKMHIGAVEQRVREAKDEVQARVLERIGKLGGVIEHNVNAEVLKQVRAQVAEEIKKTLEGK
jgi:hypothetical protein